MPEIVAAEMGKQYLRMLILLKLRVIAVTSDPMDRFIDSSLMLRLSEPVDEDEICVAVDRDIAFNPIFS